MKRLRQPCLTAVLLCASVGAAVLAPPVFAPAGALMARVWVFAVSIILAAAPYVVAGAIAAALVERVGRAGAPLALILAACAPSCDCSMNGFAGALRRAPPALAGMALTWGAVCNPIALVATHQVLGVHLLVARIAGACAAAAILAFLWTCVPLRGDAAPADCSHGDVRLTARIAAQVATGVWLLAPAAIGAALLVSCAPGMLGAHAPAWSSALLGALLSPCSAVDPVLARVVAGSLPAQAAFIIAAQCLDVRHMLLIGRHFGVARALLAAGAGIAGCACAALLAR